MNNFFFWFYYWIFRIVEKIFSLLFDFKEFSDEENFFLEKNQVSISFRELKDFDLRKILTTLSFWVFVIIIWLLYIFSLLSWIFITITKILNGNFILSYVFKTSFWSCYFWYSVMQLCIFFVWNYEENVRKIYWNYWKTNTKLSIPKLKISIVMEFFFTQSLGIGKLFSHNLLFFENSGHKLKKV